MEGSTSLLVVPSDDVSAAVPMPPTLAPFVQRRAALTLPSWAADDKKDAPKPSLFAEGGSPHGLEVLLWLIAAVAWNDARLPDTRRPLQQAMKHVQEEPATPATPLRVLRRPGASSASLRRDSTASSTDGPRHTPHGALLVTIGNRMFPLLVLGGGPGASCRTMDRARHCLKAFGVITTEAKLQRWFAKAQQAVPPREQVVGAHVRRVLKDSIAVAFLRYAAGMYHEVLNPDVFAPPAVAPMLAATSHHTKPAATVADSRRTSSAKADPSPLSRASSRSMRSKGRRPTAPSGEAAPGPGTAEDAEDPLERSAECGFPLSPPAVPSLSVSAMMDAPLPAGPPFTTSGFLSDSALPTPTHSVHSTQSAVSAVSSPFAARPLTDAAASAPLRRELWAAAAEARHLEAEAIAASLAADVVEAALGYVGLCDAFATAAESRAGVVIAVGDLRSPAVPSTAAIEGVMARLALAEAREGDQRWGDALADLPPLPPPPQMAAPFAYLTDVTLRHCGLRSIAAFAVGAVFRRPACPRLARLVVSNNRLERLPLPQLLLLPSLEVVEADANCIRWLTEADPPDAGAGTVSTPLTHGTFAVTDADLRSGGPAYHPARDAPDPVRWTWLLGQHPARGLPESTKLRELSLAGNDIGGVFPFAAMGLVVCDSQARSPRSLSPQPGSPRDGLSGSVGFQHLASQSSFAAAKSEDQAVPWVLHHLRALTTLDVSDNDRLRGIDRRLFAAAGNTLEAVVCAGVSLPPEHRRGVAAAVKDHCRSLQLEPMMVSIPQPPPSAPDAVPLPKAIALRPVAWPTAHPDAWNRAARRPHRAAARWRLLCRVVLSAAMFRRGSSRVAAATTYLAAYNRTFGEASAEDEPALRALAQPLPQHGRVTALYNRARALEATGSAASEQALREVLSGPG